MFIYICNVHLRFSMIANPFSVANPRNSTSTTELYITSAGYLRTAELRSNLSIWKPSCCRNTS